MFHSSLDPVSFGATARVDKSLKRKDPLLAHALKRYIVKNPDVFEKLPEHVTEVSFDTQQRAKLLDELNNKLNPGQRTVPGYTLSTRDGQQSTGYLDYSILGGNRLFRFLPPLQTRLEQAMASLADYAELISRNK